MGSDKNRGGIGRFRVMTANRAGLYVEIRPLITRICLQSPQEYNENSSSHSDGPACLVDICD